MLFDHLPGVSFFAKNKDFELIFANHSFLERLGFQDESPGVYHETPLEDRLQ